MQDRHKDPLDDLLCAHIENIQSKILRLDEKQDYVYASGHREHCIYINFFKQNDHINVRIDNSGEGVVQTKIDQTTQYRHQTNGEEGKKLKFYPYWIKEITIKKLGQYLRNICLSLRQTPEENSELWNWIYPKPCEKICTDLNWPASEKLRVGNCTVENHNIGYQIRLGTSFYEWLFEKEVTIACTLERPKYRIDTDYRNLLVDPVREKTLEDMELSSKQLLEAAPSEEP